MNAMRLFIALVWLSGLLPGMVQASDADRFVAASRSQQADLLTQWAAAPDASRLPLLEALQKENLYVDTQKHAFAQRDGNVIPLGDSQTAEGPTKAVRLTNRLRVLAATAIATHQLVSDSVTERRAAARQLQRDAQPGMLAFLEKRVNDETDAVARQALLLAVANLQLASPQPEVRRKAVELLGQSDDPDVQSRLTPFTQPQTEPDSAVRAAAEESLSQIQHRLMWGDLLGQAFMGLSLGSVLLLAALGLAITYGLLGVINMAHGEMLMLGVCHLDGAAGDGRACAPVAGALSRYRLAGRVLPDGGHWNGAGAHGDPSSVRSSAGNAAGDVGHQPDAYPAGAHDLWRPEPGGGEPGMALRRGAGFC